MTVIIERRFDYWDDLKFVLDLVKKHDYNSVMIIDFDIPVDLCLLRLLVRNSKKDGPVISYSSVIDGYNRLVNSRYADFCKIIEFDIKLSYTYYFYNKNNFQIEKKTLIDNNDIKLDLSKIKKIMNSTPLNKTPLKIYRQNIEKYQRNDLLSEVNTILFKRYVDVHSKNAFFYY